MPRIDELPEHRARLPRNVHNLSHKFGFTATVGHLLPVFHDFLNPGETVQLGFDYNLRTQPLASAAMVDLKSHVEYFFVPINLLYEPFGNMFYNINDSYSSLYPVGHTGTDSSEHISTVLPRLDFEDLHNVMQSEDMKVIGFEDWLCHVYRLFDMLGYNNFHLNKSGDSGVGHFNPNVFPYPILAYNCIYQYYYRLDTRELFDQRSFNWDRFYNFDSGNVSIAEWDYLKYVRLYYRPKASDYFTDVKVSPIIDVLNTNNSALTAAQQWLSGNQNISTQAGSSLNALWTTFAQHLGSGSAGAYSGPAEFSDIQSTVYQVGQVSNNDGLISQRLYTSSSSGGSTNVDRNLLLSDTNTNRPLGNARIENAHVHSVGSGITGDSAFNTANIRALFATEKLWSITGRARKHYDDQTLAHFGVSVPHDPKHEITCFGKDEGIIPIGEVISTSSSYDNNTGVYGGLGEIAGKGYGSLQSKLHKFTAPCHGVVMAILSFEPVITYGNTYLKANVLTNKNDLYQPEYDALGMQPLFGYEGNISGTEEQRNSIIGWQYRYEQWKRRFNRVSKAFQGVGNLDSWMLDFAAPQTVDQNNHENYLDYVHSPSELNQIMLVNYVTSAPQGDEERVYDGDPFVVDSFIKCKKISSMSDYSLPRLDA